MALIGAGRVATALAILLERAEYRVVAAAGREASERRVRQNFPFARFRPWAEAHEAAAAGRVVILGVPDDLIEEVCAGLAAQGAYRRGRLVVHLSGSVGLDALDAARVAGSIPIALHPLQTVPDVDGGVHRLPGSPMAVTAWDERGFAAGEGLARAAGGRPFRLRDEVKPLYHAAAVFCSNYLVAVEGMAERLFELAGVEDPVAMLAPLARASLDAALETGPARALTGPAVRGDAGTMARNLEALKRHAPDAVGPYVALATMAAHLAVRAGRLTEEGLARVEEVLRRWS